MELARAEALRAVQGDEHPAVQAAHGRQGAVRVEVPGDGVELRVEVRRRHAVEQLPDVVVAGDAGRPNRVCALERACRSASARWCARNDGDCMKNTDSAAMAMSRMA